MQFWGFTLPDFSTATRLITLCALLLGSSGSHSADESTPATTPLQNTQNLIPVLDAYYKELNRQLDKHMKNRNQNPFANPLQQTDNVRFTPAPNATAPATEKSSQQVQPRRYSDLPTMSFRGVMHSKKQKMALLEVHGLGTFVVKEGDKVGLQQVVSSGAVLHILEINDLNLIVETGSYGQQMVVQ